MGLLTSREELGVYYKPLAPALKQLQQKPESSLRREETEERGERTSCRARRESGGGTSRKSGQSDFRTNANAEKTDGGEG